MSACWMFMILMGYRLSYAAQSLTPCICESHQETVCVPAGDNVTVPCPELTGEEVTFNLFKDQEVIHNHSFGHEKNAKYRVGVELHEDKINKTVSFRLTGVNASSHGIYICEGQFTFPPPYQRKCGLKILVLVEGHQCKENDCGDQKTPGHQTSVFPWIWILVLVIIIYSIIVTIIAFVNWRKLRRADSQSDYMNTKPRAPRDRKKKRGVQTPIPRHF